MARTGGPVFDDQRRQELAGAFQKGGDHYERVRPGYPVESLDWLTQGREKIVDAVDVGAGTGKYTQLLVHRGWKVSAIDPSADMLAQLQAKFPSVTTYLGTAETAALRDESFDLAVVAQAWHWFDPDAASVQMARILRPGGILGLIWNQLDVSVPWVHRLSRIMHAGDVHKADFRPTIGPQFSTPEALLTRWEQILTPEDLIELSKSRSYYLRADEPQRAKVRSNLAWYLFEHLAYTPGQRIALPYISQTWRTTRQVA